MTLQDPEIKREISQSHHGAVEEFRNTQREASSRSHQASLLTSNQSSKLFFHANVCSLSMMLAMLHGTIKGH